jgi:hypothetical protein
MNSFSAVRADRERRSILAVSLAKINCGFDPVGERPDRDKPGPDQPWRCLWRGSVLQITRTTPLRRTTLQFLQIFFTDARTFISLSS